MDPIRDFTAAPAQEAFAFSQGSFVVDVMSERLAREYASKPHREPSVMISIQDTNNFDEFTPTEASQVKATLHLHFEDTNLPLDREDRDSNWFVKEDAHRVVRFITDEVLAKGVKHIIVHCHAGVSRSAAMAAAIEVYLNGKGADEHIWHDWHYRPNIHVYVTQMKAFGIAVNRVTLNNSIRANGITWRKHMMEVRRTLKTKQELEQWNDIWDRMAEDWLWPKRTNKPNHMFYD